MCGEDCNDFYVGDECVDRRVDGPPPPFLYGVNAFWPGDSDICGNVIYFCYFVFMIIVIIITIIIITVTIIIITITIITIITTYYSYC
jgi:hypothetical protein